MKLNTINAVDRQLHFVAIKMLCSSHRSSTQAIVETIIEITQIIFLNHCRKELPQIFTI